MKKLLAYAAIFLFGSLITNGQLPGWKTFHSDEFNFIASFPGEPEKTEDKVTTALGSGTVHRWTLELPGITYEIVVSDFPELQLKADKKTFDSVYSTACSELGGEPRDCKPTSLLTGDHFGESGRYGGFRSGSKHVRFFILLARKRFYQAIVINETSLDKEMVENQEEFFKQFNLGYLDRDKKKLHYGLPDTPLQNQKDN